MAVREETMAGVSHGAEDEWRLRQQLWDVLRQVAQLKAELGIGV